MRLKPLVSGAPFSAHSDKFISHALIPYYQALRHHMAYNGWRSDEFAAWEELLKVVFPGIIREPEDPPS